MALLLGVAAFAVAAVAYGYLCFRLTVGTPGSTPTRAEAKRVCWGVLVNHYPGGRTKTSDSPVAYFQRLFPGLLQLGGLVVCVEALVGALRHVRNLRRSERLDAKAALLAEQDDRYAYVLSAYTKASAAAATGLRNRRGHRKRRSWFRNAPQTARGMRDRLNSRDEDDDGRRRGRDDSPGSSDGGGAPRRPLLLRSTSSGSVGGDKPAARHSGGFTIRFDGLCYRIKGGRGRRVLKGASGVLCPGRVAAIMGPSGAGKTTLLHLLCGKNRPERGRGSIDINNLPGCRVTDLQRVVGLVTQEDVMLGRATVQEVLWFSACLRLPARMSRRDKWHQTQAVIDLLGLTDVKHALVGDARRRGISGGQRKRVNIGCELVAMPAILFLDEPTSGLDASAALEVCTALKAAAGATGVTVCAVVHQPRFSVFKQFDDLILLCKGGVTAYSGPRRGAQRYFERLRYAFDPRENPADVLIDILCGHIQPHNSYDRDDDGGDAGGGGGGENGSGGAADASMDSGGAAPLPVPVSPDGGGGAAASASSPVPATAGGGGGGGGRRRGRRKRVDAATHLQLQWRIYKGGAAESALQRMTRSPSTYARARRRARMTGAAPPSLSAGDPLPGDSSDEGMSGGFAKTAAETAAAEAKAAEEKSERVAELKLLRGNHGRRTAGALAQCAYFLRRSAVQHARLRFNVYRNALMLFVIGVLLGGLYKNAEDGWGHRCVGQTGPHAHCGPDHRPIDDYPALAQKRNGQVFCKTAEGGWMGAQQRFTLAVLVVSINSMQGALDLFGDEVDVVVAREARWRYSHAAYCVAKFASQLPLTLLYPYVFLLAFYTVTDPQYMTFAQYYAVFFLTQLAGEGWGHFISIAANANRQVVAGLFALLCVMLTGSFPVLNSATIQHVSYFSFCRWPIEQLFALTYGDIYHGGVAYLEYARQYVKRGVLPPPYQHDPRGFETVLTTAAGCVEAVQDYKFKQCPHLPGLNRTQEAVFCADYNRITRQLRPKGHKGIMDRFGYKMDSQERVFAAWMMLANACASRVLCVVAVLLAARPRSPVTSGLRWLARGVRNVGHALCGGRGAGEGEGGRGGHARGASA